MATNPSDRDPRTVSVETDTVGHVHIGDGAGRPTAAVTEAIERATGERPDRETLRRRSIRGRSTRRSRRRTAPAGTAAR